MLRVDKRCHHKATSVLQKSIALPDVHSGYGFAIGNVAAFDMADPEAIVSPGGVGFDINCGVRLIRTNLVGNYSECAHGESSCSVECGAGRIYITRSDADAQVRVLRLALLQLFS